MTRDEFIRNYTNDTPEIYRSMNESGRFAIPCECSSEICNGWQMAYASEVDRHIERTLGNETP